jgi:hypothetical protein
MRYRSSNSRLDELSFKEDAKRHGQLDLESIFIGVGG